MRVTYYGQACTLVEAGGLKILTDPWLTEGAYQGTWFHTHVLADAGVTPQTFPKDIDYLFLSHEHQDHLDVATLKHFPAQTPILICRYPSATFRDYVKSLGFTNIQEFPSGEGIDLGNGVTAMIFNTVEYTNDSAILIEHDGVRLFNETDCKLSYSDLQKIGNLGIDIGFYMFSGANWFPMMYDYPADTMVELIRRRRKALLHSFVQRVKLTKPRVAVPAAGPCTVLDSEMLWMNQEDRGIFIDPVIAINALREANLRSEPLYMVASDSWDSRQGFQPHAPASLRAPREEYLAEAAERMAPVIAAARKAEPPAHPDVNERLRKHFNSIVGAQSQFVRDRVNAKLAFVITGAHPGEWTVDFNSPGPEFVREGILPDWTYKIEVEDRLISPFVSGEEPFFEDLMLSLRFRCARRPDQFNEPLYHFLYEANPERLHNWYAKD
jgi:UDP-MurNAc hydroxylase